MTTNQYITINSITFNPTSVETSVERVGESRRMADGSLKFYHRADKKKWTLQWTSVRAALVINIEDVASITNTTTFIDYDNTSHTVVFLPGAFKKTLSADKVTPSQRYYDVTLVVDEV